MRLSEVIEAVGCPVCGSNTGEQCQSMHRLGDASTKKRYAVQPHAGRLDLYRGMRDQLLAAQEDDALAAEVVRLRELRDAALVWRSANVDDASAMERADEVFRADVDAAGVGGEK